MMLTATAIARRMSNGWGLIVPNCPRCGGQLVARLLKSGDPKRLVCTSCHNVLYLDPKVAVGTIIRNHESRIMLVQRAIEVSIVPNGAIARWL